MNQTMVSSATGVLKRVLLCSPDNIAIEPIDYISKQWYDNNYHIDVAKCKQEHNDLINTYIENGVEVELIDFLKEGLASQVFTRDIGATLKEGYILGRFKELIRHEETDIAKNILDKLGLNCIAKCEKGCFEGGDFWQLEEKLLAIGILQRSNEEGINNIREQLNSLGYEIMTVRSKKEYLHLDMIFNIIAEKVAVACIEALPENLLNYLEAKKYEIIDISEQEIFKHYNNVQSLGNDRVISFKNNKVVNERMKALGLKVIELDLSEILKAGGGVHCMTFPLERG